MQVEAYLPGSCEFAAVLLLLTINIVSLGDEGRKRPCCVYSVQDAGNVGSVAVWPLPPMLKLSLPPFFFPLELECGIFLAGCEARLSVQRLAL